MWIVTEQPLSQYCMIDSKTLWANQDGILKIVQVTHRKVQEGKQKEDKQEIKTKHKENGKLKP